MQTVGYQRVSTLDQNTERQLDGVAVDRMFTDKATGANANRPALQDAVDYVREGDVFVVHSMDRLARNLQDLRGLVDRLTNKGVQVRFIKEGLTFTGKDSPMNTLLLSMLGAVAEFERSLIRERQREGIAIAKTQGKYKGGTPKLTGKQVNELIERKQQGAKIADLAREYGLSRQTVYNYLNKKDVPGASTH